MEGKNNMKRDKLIHEKENKEEESKEKRRMKVKPIPCLRKINNEKKKLTGKKRLSCTKKKKIKNRSILKNN